MSGVKGRSGRWRNTSEMNWRTLWNDCRDDLVYLGNYLRTQVKESGLKGMLADDENARLYSDWLRIAAMVFTRGMPQKIEATLDTNILTAVFPSGKEIKIGQAVQEIEAVHVDEVKTMPLEAPVVNDLTPGNISA